MSYSIESYEPVTDENGQKFHCGLWLPSNKVTSAFPLLSSAVNHLDSATVQKLLNDPDRTPASQVFADPHWVVEGNQEQHGSCNGWAGASALSKARYKAGITDGTVFSGSYVYSRINGGYDNGSALEDGMKELMSFGAPPAAQCNADMIYRNQTSQFDGIAANNEGLACYAVQDQSGLDTAVALGMIVVVAVQVDRTRFVNFTGTGVLAAFNGPGNHAIHCDDARVVNGQIQYRVVNNWGINWGNNGTAWVTFASFAQTMQNHMFYAVPSVKSVQMAD